MRPRWRSRGDGPDGCTPCGPQRQRRTAAAELVVLRGMTACGQGKKVGGAVAGQSRTGARPAQKRGRLGLRRMIDRDRRWRSAPHQHAQRRRCGPTSRGHGHLPPTQRHQPRPTPNRPCRARCRCRTAIGREPLQVRTCSDQTGASKSESKDAISVTRCLEPAAPEFRRDDRFDRFQLFEGSMRR